MSTLPRARELAPGLLVAMPQLADPHFERSVVLLFAHGEEGSMGLVLNQPTELLTHTLLENLDVSWQGERTARIHKGGPVDTRVGWVLHSPVPAPLILPTSDGSRPLPIVRGMSLSTSPALLKALAMRPPPHMRVMLGHSGWGPGQLASEISRGAWLYADATPELVFETAPSLMWERSLATLGITAASLVAAPHGAN